MAYVFIEKDILNLACLTVHESAALVRWLTCENPKIVYTEDWDGVTTPNLPQTQVGLLTRNLAERGIVIV